MQEVINIDSVKKYNELKGIDTRHPLISVFDSSIATPLQEGKFRFNFYAIFLKGVNGCDMLYGRNIYDYEEGSMVFVGPGQFVEIKSIKNYNPKGKALIFHPEFIHGTSLGKIISEYSFFDYELNEALHLSRKEQQSIIELFDKIDYELDQNIDQHSKSIIATNIELLLNYCKRFYDRQFITRENLNHSIITKFDKQLNNYFKSEIAQTKGFPTVSYFANEFNLSPNYFGDLVKKETGKSASEIIQLKIIEVSKDLILDVDKSISEIAYELGFKYPQHFTRVFKKNVGVTPGEYRKSS